MLLNKLRNGSRHSRWELKRRETAPWNYLVNEVRHSSRCTVPCQQI